jgi:hypothetical protein
MRVRRCRTSAPCRRCGLDPPSRHCGLDPPIRHCGLDPQSSSGAEKYQIVGRLGVANPRVPGLRRAVDAPLNEFAFIEGNLGWPGLQPRAVELATGPGAPSLDQPPRVSGTYARCDAFGSCIALGPQARPSQAHRPDRAAQTGPTRLCWKQWWWIWVIGYHADGPAVIADSIARTLPFARPPGCRADWRSPRCARAAARRAGVRRASRAGRARPRWPPRPRPCCRRRP